MKENSESVFERGFTTRAVAIGIIAAIALTIFFDLGQVFVVTTKVKTTEVEEVWPFGMLYGTGVWMRPREYLVVYFSFFSWLILLCAVTPKRYRLKPAEILTVLALTLPTMSMSGAWMSYSISWGVSALTPAYTTFFTKYASPLWAPKDINILRPMVQKGGIPVPWDAWTVPIIYWIMTYTSYFFFFMFGMMILRKIWVDIEALSFPVAASLEGAINLTTTDGEGKTVLWKSKMTLVGILISAITGFVYLLGNFYPPAGYPQFLFYDYTPNMTVLLPVVFVYTPWLIGFTLLVPRGANISTAIVWIILFMIIGPILSNMGLLAQMRPGMHGWRAWYDIESGWDAPVTSIFKASYMPMIFGMMCILALMPIIRHRGIIASQLKSAFGSQKDKEESIEPVSYRTMWVGMLACGGIFIGMMMAAGIAIQWALLFVLYAWIFAVSIGRVRAETGLFMGGGSCLPGVNGTETQWGWFIYTSGVSKDPSAGWWGTGALDYHLIAPHIASYASYRTPYEWGSESYKIAYEKKAGTKDIFLSHLIGIVIPIVVGIPLFTWAYYTYGMAGRYARSYFWQDVNIVQGTFSDPQRWWNEVSVTMFIVGIVLMILMLWARGRFSFLAWFTPASIVAAVAAGSELWIPCLIAYIVQTVVARIGGEPLMKQKIHPLAIGLMVGYGLIVLLSGIALFLNGVGYKWW